MSERYLTAVEAKDKLRCTSMASLYSFLYRRRKAGFSVKTSRRGRVLLFLERDLEAALTVEDSRRSLRKVG
jgi:hypothetical protein